MAKSRKSRTRPARRATSRPPRAIGREIDDGPNVQPVPSVPTTAGGQTGSVSPPPPVRDTRQQPRIWYIAIGTTMLVLVTFMYFAFRMVSTIEEQNQQLVQSSKAFRDVTMQITDLRNGLARKDDLLRVLSARTITMTALKGAGSYKNGWGRLLWDPAKRAAILQVEGLPPSSAGQGYQIWLARGEREWSAGVFSVTEAGSMMFRIEKLPAISPPAMTTVAVTRERAGGAVRHQGPVCLTGETRM